jgi:hypothetical protein
VRAVLPSGLNTTQRTMLLGSGPWSVRISFPPARSQSLNRESPIPDERAVCPSGLNDTLRALWLGSLRISLPVDRSQNLSVPSRYPERAVRPSGLIATLVTARW